MSIAVCSFNLHCISRNIKHRDIESSATQIIDNNFLPLFLIKAVSQGGGCRFINDTLDVQTGNKPGIFSRLALRVIKISGDGNDSFSNFLADFCFRVGFKLRQDHSRNFLRRIIFASHLHLDTLSRLHNLIRHRA